jgi:t-SNARE complex subunit (syntaxin)
MREADAFRVFLWVIGVVVVVIIVVVVARAVF